MTPNPHQPVGMNELREILEPLKRGAGPAQRKEAEAAVQQLVERCIPEKINDSRPNDFDVNETIDEFRHNLQQAGLLRADMQDAEEAQSG